MRVLTVLALCFAVFAASAQQKGKKPADEPFARLVPHDNYYISFKSIRKFIEFGELSEEWGSPLTSAYEVSSRDFDLKGTAALMASAAPDAPTAFELPFVVQGPWADPLVWPDPQILINRSGAAAPLLDAVRNRLKREAKPAIEPAAEPEPEPSVSAIPPASPPAGPTLSGE
jgi:AsmA protein